MSGTTRNVAHVAMGQLPRGEGVGDDTDDVAPRSEGSVGHDPHEPYGTASEDEADPVGRESPSQLLSGVAVERVGAVARTAEDTKTLHVRGR